jgi:hypothetical protein
MSIRPSTLLLALGLVGCAATGDEGRADGLLTFTLEASPRNAGQIGQGALLPDGDQTLMTLTVSGVPPWTTRPVHIFTFVHAGSCASHDSSPAFALNETVQPMRQGSLSRPFVLRKTVPLPLDALRSPPHAVILRTSPADGFEEIFCGELR